ncbi:4Fe-4S dicluster domain-containing protein [Desulfonema limicola]|uniref:4Fe-4S dicluster domain-containing protein n=1 Tax=Desulfonema limicola TaxID=45656 RepID=A0A975GH29_9BACT|nr:DUF362 domain-containing protein [Desulfonema limicola]QTA80849.1 4Fe-4S dicluster domain-containing protein [Desulfonema limicola]
MESTVYFMDLRTSPKENLFGKLERLLDKAGLETIFSKRDLIAVKLHFGELGNTAFIRPVFLRKIVEKIKAKQGIPFLTDANTLYAGTRSNAVNHLQTAIQNGFAYSVVDAPLVIADGLRGKSETAVQINRKRFKEVYIGSEIVQADALISVAHFKGHELSGFGGAIKNVGMGSASRKGKLAQHSNLGPKVNIEKCIGCGDCTEHCSQYAISLKDEKAVIDLEKCIGCGECILICPNSAIEIQWNQAIPVFLENMVEYTEGVLKNKKGKTLYLNFITNISPACDCYAYNDSPIVRDIGIAASKDPVAIDQACADLVNKEHALPGSCLEKNHKPGEDKFKGLYPEVDWTIQLDYAQELGLGTRKYKLEKI